jgi:hypothetical protein
MLDGLHLYRLEARPFMAVLERFESLTPGKLTLAWTVAIAADATQLALIPLFGEGALSPLDTVLDIVVGILLVRLLGWHWAFLPTLAAELIPGVDLFPTWTVAVWFVSRQRLKEMEHSESVGSEPAEWSTPVEGEILPPDPSFRRG